MRPLQSRLVSLTRMQPNRKEPNRGHQVTPISLATSNTANEQLGHLEVYTELFVLNKSMKTIFHLEH